MSTTTKKPEKKQEKVKSNKSNANARYDDVLWVLPCISCKKLRRLSDVMTISQEDNGAKKSHKILRAKKRKHMNPYDAQVQIYMCLVCMNKINEGEPIA